MNPRPDQRPPSTYDEPLHVEEDSYLDTPEVAVKEPKAVRTPFGFDAAFLMLIGVGAVAGGVVLSIGPRVSWKLSQLADGFKHLGVQGGVLVMGGLILAALGLLRRGQIALRAPSAEQAEDRQLLEQLTKDALRVADDLSRVESGLAHVEAELTTTRRELEIRIASAARDVIAAIPPPVETPSSEEAIFRLAASLDQVGMRIEQRLKTQYTALQDHLEDVGAAILSARNHMQGLSGPGDERAAVLREEVQAQVESALEETGFRSNGRRALKGPSLGVLDTIEDDSDQALPDIGSIASALPMNPEEAREHGCATPEEIDTKTRLIQLSTLLADPLLRKALEGISNPSV